MVPCETEAAVIGRIEGLLLEPHELIRRLDTFMGNLETFGRMARARLSVESQASAQRNQVKAGFASRSNESTSLLLKSELLREMGAEPDDDDPDAVPVMIVFPCGKRVARRFSRRQSLRALHNFVFCMQETVDAFEISTARSKRALLHCSEETPPTFQEAGLLKETTVFVRSA
jgi:hypothetical protein